LAKLYFSYAAMNAGKSTLLLQASHNYRERGMNTILFTAALDDRAGITTIASRIGLKATAKLFSEGDDLFLAIKSDLEKQPINCIFVDEAQFLTKQQVWQLARVADRLGVPVMCYGLRTDFQGKLFPGSSELLAIADILREIRTICHCGAKATMVVRLGDDGAVLIEGDQVAIGGNERYVSLCRKHWEEKTGSWPVEEESSPTLEFELNGGGVGEASARCDGDIKNKRRGCPRVKHGQAQVGSKATNSLPRTRNGGNKIK